MRIPVVRGVIERRMLVNFRVDPLVLARSLPTPFRPKLVSGAGLAGICLIRLKHVRPVSWPQWTGVSSENAAHRVAVEWDSEDGAIREGVFVRRRDTSSLLNSWAGGRLFPGISRRARFAVDESDDRLSVSLRSVDGETDIVVRGRRAAALPSTSAFRSLDEASAFFHAGSLGYSATPDPSRFQGMELHCCRWSVEPLDVDEVRSSHFDDPSLFPKGSIEFDCALLMRDIEHEWHGKPDLHCLSAAAERRFQLSGAV